MKIMVGAVAFGAGFGAATALVNAVSSPYSALGSPIAGTVWAGAARVVSLLMDVGWAWAGLPAAMGWLARTRARGAVAGAVVLVAATVAYFVVDAPVRGESFVPYLPEMVLWSVAGVLFGPVLGVVGASIRRPGVVGLLAAVAVPVGAAVQMIVLPPRAQGHALAASTILAEVIVWTAAAVGVGVSVFRFWGSRREPAAR